MTGEDRAEQPTPRYCDLVMKGGITSGLVYPEAVRRIGQVYRFKNIGGTSAGAIAAAVSAAAALGERRRYAKISGTGGLERLEKTAADLTREGFIFSLFQPVKKARRVFRMVVNFAANPGGSPLPLIFGTVRLAPGIFILALFLPTGLAFVIGGLRGVLAAFLPSLVLALAAAIAGAATLTAATIRSNFLGMCPGIRQDPNAPAGLSEWMHQEIRALSGLGEGDGAPVTFGDLWSAPLYEDESSLGEDERALNLEVITTDVSHSEPRTLPFTKGTLWFREADMKRLFPTTVVKAMLAGGELPPITKGGVEYHAFPAAEKLPVVVAARMSLSFPLLICAVPLYEQHFMKGAPSAEERKSPAQAAESTTKFAETLDELTIGAADGVEQHGAVFEMRVCWFTDGGVSSNFPIHLFDAPMPRWPTFAIDLVYPAGGRQPDSDPVFLPASNNQGWRPTYTSIARDRARNEIAAFLTAIISTMQNWRDLLQGRAPGHRDRIVQVEINPDEGGMNLNMPQKVLTAVAAKGGAAGERLIGGFEFENHFWVRYRNLQAALERFGVRLETVLAAPPEGAQDAFRCAKEGKGSPPSYKFTAAQSKEAVHRLDELLQEFETWADWDGSLAKGAPNPPPHLRIVPIF